MSEVMPSNPNKASHLRDAESNDTEIFDISKSSPQNTGPVLRGPGPGLKKGRGKRSRQNPRSDLRSDPATDISADDRDGIQNSEDESTAYPADSGVTKSRRRARVSHTRPSQTAAQGNNSISSDKPPSQAQEVPWLLQITEDGWRMIKFALRLPKKTYPIWKWVLFGYLVCLGISYLLDYLYRFAADSLAPACSLPVLGPLIPFCIGPSELKDGWIDATKVVTSQEELTVVMDRVGQNFDLAKDIVAHEFTLRDLRIRVAASNLARSKEIAQELDSLIRLSKGTAKDLSRFTARVGKSVDAVNTFDNFAVKALEGISEQQRTPPTISKRIVSAINPLAVLDRSNPNHSEEQIKHLFVSTATHISGKVQRLMDDSFELGHNFDSIQETLDRIRELVIDEVGDLPRMDVLGALWARLARKDDYEEHKSHESLLTDLTSFYESSSIIMRETFAALNRVEAELTEFRDDFATPGLILKDFPLEVIVDLLKKSGQRLESGRRQLENIEGGQPARIDAQKASARTLTATIH